MTFDKQNQTGSSRNHPSAENTGSEPAAPDQHAALVHQRTLTARIMKALMATGRRDDLLLADEVHRADDAHRKAIAKALGQSEDPS